MSNLCAKPYRVCEHQPASLTPPHRLKTRSLCGRLMPEECAPRWTKPHSPVCGYVRSWASPFIDNESKLSSPFRRAATLARNGAGLTSSVEHFVARPPWEPQHQER